MSAIDGSGTPTAGVTLAAGSGSWSALSDRNAKANVLAVDADWVLDKLAQLDISQWNYVAQSPDVVHVGPMAQDFYRIFGLGEDERYISHVDISGVALAAIKALQKQNRVLHHQNAELENRLATLEDALDRLQQLAAIDRR